MALSSTFFNKREPEASPQRHAMPNPTSGGYGAAGAPRTHQPEVPAVVAPVVASTPTKEGGSKLTVGPNIKLKGVEITDCDTLVVEGLVEATMDSRVIQISEHGAFKGSAEIDVAEIHGQFDGNLTVRQKLVIYATGKVTGNIRYGKLVIEEGGQLTGDIQFGTAHPTPHRSSEKPALAVAA